MLAVDDILDDAHWVNVQDPIKQMFLSMTKALRVQAASIRELDRKCSDFVTRDFVRNQVHSVEDTVCSKQDATQIIHQLQQKVDQKEHTTLQTRYEQVVQHADRLQSTVQDQALEIQSLQTHIGHLEKEIEALKNPSYDQIFAYIDRQVQHVTEDTERKLTIKADKREMETVIPQRLEDLYRTLNRKVQDLKVDVARTATKEELIAIAQTKAERTEVRDIAADLHDKVSRGETAGLLASQTKPLFTALAAIEKAQQAQDQRLFAQVQDIADRQQSMQRLYQDHLTTHHSAEAQHQQQQQQHGGLATEKVTAIVHEYLRERKLEDLTRVHLDGLFANHTEYLLKQMGIVGESIRLEVVATQREEMTIFKQQHEGHWRDTLAQAKELSEKHAKTRQAVKELSTNVSKALSRKVDVHEYQKLLKKWDTLDALEERLYHDVRRSNSSSRGGGGGGGGAMSPAGRSRRNVVSSNDPNETFDVLIQSLKTSSSSSSSSASEGGPQGSPSRRSTHRHHPDDADLDEDGYEAFADGGDGAKPSIRKSFPLPSSSMSSSPLRGSRRSTTTTTTTLRNGGSVSPSKRMGHATASRLPPPAPSSHLDALYGELETLQQQVQLLTKKLANQSLAGTPAEVERLDWRIALGDVSMHLRRELADKVSREELLSLLRDEAALLAQKVKPLEVMMEKEWPTLSKTLPATVHQVQQDLLVMQQRVAAEIQGARFLWTSGRYTSLTPGGGGGGGSSGAGVLSASCWVPWERQVLNASPQVLLWRRDSPVITVKVPGLYVLTVSIFTTNLQAVARVLVYLNDEPLCQLRTTAPPTVGSSSSTSSSSQRVSPTASSSASAVGLGGSQVAPMVTPITKYRHSLGDVCSYTMEEYVSLPPEARLTVCILPSSVTFAMDSAGGSGGGGGGNDDSGRVIGAQSAPQGFLALRKL